jgi:hypothetical protein
VKSASHQITVTGQFADYLTITSEHLKPSILSADGTVLASAEPSVEGKSVKAWIVNSLQATVLYTLPIGGAEPSVLSLLDSNGVPRPFSLSNNKTTETLVPHKLVIMGDFCMPVQMSSGLPQPCSTGLLANTKSPPRAGSGGLLYSTDGATSTPVTVTQISQTTASIEYIADPSFHAQWISLTGMQGPRTFLYKPAAPDVATDAVYRASDFDIICPGRTKMDEPVAPAPCAADKQPTITAVGPSSDIGATLVSMSGNLLFTRITSSGGVLPEVLLVHSAGGQQTVLARRLTTATTDQSLISVGMTIMDQETVHRNYGPNIAGHYIAVQLNVTNRTAKKLQFNKSAVWFDVDYKETHGPRVNSGYDYLSKASIDAIPARVYNPPFVETGDYSRNNYYGIHTKKTHDPLHFYRFGIEQNSRVYPDSYMSILGAFDFANEKANRLFDYVQLFGGALTTIATGGSVAQVHNSAFRDAATILTGVFLPGFRTTTLDVAGTDRLRANLVQQTLQETVPVPPNGFTSTIVLLPRDGILDIAGYSKAVVIDRILEAHIDPDVLNGVKDPPVAANHVELNYTKDQVRQALGDAPNVATDASGVSVFTYSQGPYLTVTFDKMGKVTAFSPRSLTDQLTGAQTLSEARAILMANSASSKSLTLVNKDTILVDISTVTKVPEYGVDGKRKGDYTLLYDSIQALVTPGTETKKAFETAIKALIPAGAVLPTPGVVGSSTSSVWIYPMPDIQGGQMTITFAATPVNDSTPIKSISFTGEKP